MVTRKAEGSLDIQIKPVPDSIGGVEACSAVEEFFFQSEDIVSSASPVEIRDHSPGVVDGRTSESKFERMRFVLGISRQGAQQQDGQSHQDQFFFHKSRLSYNG